jgi:ABC-type phosphate/phosphonate transport system permease subunit
MPLAFIMDRAMPTIVWFRLSTMPFCCGEYGTMWCHTTP